MANLFISEYANAGYVPFQVAAEPALADQVVAIGVSSAQSTAFNKATTVIRVHAAAICSILIGNNPTALTTSKRMPADSTEYFGVNPGDKIAVISNT